MIGFFLRVLTDVAVLSGLLLGMRALPAIKALEEPSANSVASAFRVSTFCLFVAAAGLFLLAALADWFFGRNVAHDQLGWAGVIAVNLCVICALRYRHLNRASANRPPEEASH